MIWVFDARETLRSVLSNDSPGGCPYWDDEHVESLDGTLTYKFSCAADHEASSWLEVGGYIAITDLDGQIVLFQIRQIEQDSDDQGRYYVVDAENAALELLGNYIRPSTWAGYTAEQAMQTALAGTRWQPGQVDWLGTQTLKFDQMTTVFEALQQIRAAFGGEFAFRVELQGNRIVGRYIDLLEQRGSTTLKRFEYRKDLKGVKRTVDMSQLCTAIIGQGKSNGDGAVTTFASVEWRKANGDPVDKPLGQDWVGDDDALEQYGRDGQHIFGLYVDDQQDDPRALLEAAWQELQVRKQPLVTYEMDAILLERAVKSLDGDEAYEHERVRLGDTVVVRDEEFDPPLVLTARVISLTRSYSDPTRDSVVLGQFRPAFADRTTQVLLDLQARVQTVNLTDLGGQVGSTQIGSGAVGDSHIDRTSANRLQVQTADIADAAITTAKIANAAIGTAQIADAAITSAKIDSIIADKIQGGTLTLGGQNNTNGVAAIKTSNGFTLLTLDQNGLSAYSPDGTIRLFINPNNGYNSAIQVQYRDVINNTWVTGFDVRAGEGGGVVVHAGANTLEDGNGGLWVSGTLLLGTSVGIGIGSPLRTVHLAPPKTTAVGMDAYGNLLPINPDAMASGSHYWNIYDRLGNSVLQVYVDGTKKVQVNGTFSVSGSKSAVVKDSHGNDLYLYSIEGPENRFEDMGRAQTDETGAAVVQLDPTFLEAVDTTDADYEVWLTGIGAAGFYEDETGRTPTSFVVKGPPNAQFRWRVTAWRKGYRGKRFNEAQQVQ